MTRQQAWAQVVLEKVQGYENADRRKELATWCMKMPSLIKQSGLLQALAFARAKCDASQCGYADDLAECYARGLGTELQGPSPSLALLQQINTSSLPAYLALTRDVSTVSLWFRRFAQSELKADNTDVAN